MGGRYSGCCTNPIAMTRRANASSGEYLPDPHFGPLGQFTRHRAFNSSIASHLVADENLIDLGKRIGNCAAVLGLEIAETTDERLETRLRAHRPCNARLCPWCEWRRTKAWRARLIGGLGALEVAQPKLVPVFLTLTVQNPLLTDLRETLREMNAAWLRMIKGRWFPTDLWFRRTEITVSANPYEPVKAHPHFHVLLMVPPSYFGVNYIRQTEWRSRWMTALRADYPPVVDIRRATGKNKNKLESPAGSSLQLDASVSAAVEAAKYLSKATHLLELGDTLPEFHWQTRGLRLYACSKSLRSFIRDGDITPEEMNDSVFQPAEITSPITRATAVWFEDTKEYLFVQMEEGPPLIGSEHAERAKTGSRAVPCK